MYYNDYEDYMRSVLGYNSANSNMYNQEYYMPNRMQCNMGTYQNMNSCSQMQDNMEELYPDIYKIVNPIVCKVCQNNTKPITNDLLEQMVSEVYSNINADDINIVNINIETGDVVTNNRTIDSKEQKISKEQRENRTSEEKRNRRPNNPLLRDLIKILLLNSLIGGPRPGPRPPYRPPFPGGPGMPGGTPPRPPFPPPMRPRFDQNEENNQDMSQMMYGYGNYYNY